MLHLGIQKGPVPRSCHQKKLPRLVCYLLRFPRRARGSSARPLPEMAISSPFCLSSTPDRCLRTLRVLSLPPTSILHLLGPSETRRRYDQTASRYDARYSELQRSKYPVLLDIMDLAPGQRILDWGCGTCLALGPINEAGATYIGLDFSSGMLSAREKGPKGHVVLGDCTRLPFRAGSFDGVLGATVIQNIRRRPMAIAELSRVLKEGGRVALSFPRKMKVGIRGLAGLGLTPTGRVSCGEDLALGLEKQHTDLV